uniref:Uncharacterized protein n=1 Tax=Timema shepardi TaxID=629360 RepID=A0A7R9APZ3_TIMSH|nr:unnamed protein product [Timema shepardi]
MRKVGFSKSVPELAWRKSGKNIGGEFLTTPNRDSNLDPPVIGSLVQHDGDALDHATNKAGALLRRSSLDPDRRRFSLGTSTPHRASDASLDPHHAAMLFRDSRGLANALVVLSSTAEDGEIEVRISFG